MRRSKREQAGTIFDETGALEPPLSYSNDVISGQCFVLVSLRQGSVGIELKWTVRWIGNQHAKSVIQYLAGGEHGTVGVRWTHTCVIECNCGVCDGVEVAARDGVVSASRINPIFRYDCTTGPIKRHGSRDYRRPRRPRTWRRGRGEHVSVNVRQLEPGRDGAGRARIGAGNRRKCEKEKAFLTKQGHMLSRTPLEMLPR